MKNLKKVCLLLGIVCLQACHGEIEKRTYQLYNNTDRTIKISFFRTTLFFSDTPIQEYTNEGESLIYEGNTFQGRGDSYSIEEALNADSIVVFFDNERIQRYHVVQGFEIFSTPPSERNIFSDESYEVINNNLYRFTFTEEDYENAEEL